MSDSTEGERVGRSSRFSASYLIQKIRKHGKRDSSRPSSKAEASPARSAASSNPLAISQETDAAINACATSANSPNTSGATGAADKPLESETDNIEEIVNVESDLWSRAYQKLDDKTKKWITDASKQESGEEKTQELIKVVQKREEEYKDATPKLRIGDQEIMWRDYANRVVAWVTAIGDISINFAPAPSSVVWSAVKVLLKANASQREDIAAIFGCADRVLRLIKHGKVYEEVYLSGGSCNLATQNLQDTLVDLYKALMELLAHGFTRLNEGQGKQFLRALISGGEGAKLVSALEDHERNVSTAAEGCGAIASQEHQKLLQALDEPLRNIEVTMKKLLEKVENETLQQALDYISTIPIGEHQLEKQEARTPETCEWLLNHAKFLEWKESSSSILWLQGNVGAGKSFLASKVIEYLPASHQQKFEYDEGVAFFYCSRSDPVRRETKHILRSYVSQLAKVPNRPNMMESNLYALYLKTKIEKRGFSMDECEMVLMSLINYYPRTTLILDALDECELSTRKALTRILRNLVDKGEGTVKVFIASRKEADIEVHLASQRLVEISTADNKNDIEKYIEVEMANVDGVWRSVSADVKEQVKKTIGEKSDGMFRWAYLQWEQLKKLRSNELIIERLGKLPENLTAAYDEIYTKIEEKEILQRAVKWVLCAREPLTSEVLLMAIRLKSNLLSLTLSDPIDESTLEDICSHLIVLDSQLKVWKFPHASVVEYFENRHKSWIDKADEDVAALIVSCLIECYSEWTPPESGDELRGFLKTASKPGSCFDPRHPLQRYTRQYWLPHVQNTANQYQEATQLSEILKRFLGAQGPQRPSSLQYQKWCTHMGLVSGLWYNYGWHEDIQPSDKSILGICVLGLHKLLKGWWDEGIDVSQVNNLGLDLLAIAVKHGHEELCSELIDRGSEIHRGLDSLYGSAFMEAIGNSQVETARLLLDKGVDPNLIRRGRSPLCWAVKGAEDLVELLLTAGADPNITCSSCGFGCALEAATFEGRTNSAELLLKAGADVNLATEENEYGSPLGMAACRGSLKGAKLFVKNGANVNAHLRGKYGSVLAAAIFGHGGVNMVKYLIEEAGADPAILSSSPPPNLSRIKNIGIRAREVAKYLLDGGHVQESVLLDIGFSREDLPTTEIEG